jgi:hypothetical protein
MSLKSAVGFAGKVVVLLVLLGSGSAGIWYFFRSEGLMQSVYLFPVLVALAFFLLGFFLKAFFATKGSLVSVSKKVDDIRTVVLEMQKEAAAGQKDSPGKNPAEALERQIRHSKEQMDRLQRLTLRFEETIELLHREAEAIRSLIVTPQRVGELPAANPMWAASTPPGPGSPPAAKEQKASARAGDDEDSNPPAWQKSLSDILGDMGKKEDD